MSLEDADTLTPDDELDLIMLDLIELLRAFGLGKQAVKDVADWRIDAMWQQAIANRATHPGPERQQ